MIKLYNKYLFCFAESHHENEKNVMILIDVTKSDIYDFLQ